MNPQQTQEIINLAKQVGGKAWQALVQQQIAIGINQLVWAGFLFIILVVATVVAIKCGVFAFRSERPEDASEAQEHEDRLTAAIVAGIIAAIVGVILLFVTFGLTLAGISHLMFPQAYAIQALLGN